MNILFVSSVGRDTFGGGEKWMVDAAKGLAARGHHVVLGSKGNSKTLKCAAANGVQTTVFEIHGDFSPLNTLRIAAYQRRHAVDVMICNLNKDVRVAGLAARISGKPLVLARHGMLLCGNTLRHKLSLTKLTDGIITNSKTIRDTYAGYGWFDDDFVKVIYNGITIPRQVVPYDFAGRYPGKKIIYSAGRLSEQKGFTFLIEAAAILRRTRDDLVFAISGEGGLEADLKRQAAGAGLEESFVFTGFAEDIYPYLAGCDLFVLASLFEGMPNVVMEAMAVQKPAVATDVNGARELIVDGETGLLVPPKDPEALAGAIAAVIDNPDLLIKFGRAGHERVSREFTMSAMVDNLERHLQQKLREKHRHP
jgi:glycosyltransferase involved in cell wall biosynthesis